MGGHHFLSYSSVDGKNFALKLHDALEGGDPSFAVWMDVHDLKPGEDWDEQISEAIKDCRGLLFVMTADSVRRQSTCKREWGEALHYKKPVIPLLVDPDARRPFRLGTRQHIDFTGRFDTGLARLRQYLAKLDSVEHRLYETRRLLDDHRFELERPTEPARRQRLQKDMADLQQEIARLEIIAADPAEADRRVQQRIKTALERERRPAKPVGGESSTIFINTAPVVPAHFQDRQPETAALVDFLKNDALRLMTVVGRAGAGKTALVCRLLRSLEAGQLPDGLGQLKVDGIVYLSANGARQVTFPHLYGDLCRLVPGDAVGKLKQIYQDPRASIQSKMRALLAQLSRGTMVVLLDNFEDVVAPETRKITDAELKEALQALLALPHHGVKLILTTRVPPADLAQHQAGRQRSLSMEMGLASPYAENQLKAMDPAGQLGLRDARASQLDRARELTLGNPRALEAIVGILAADHDTSLTEELDKAQKHLPEEVVHVLVGEAFHRLDHEAQMAVQALAAFGRPVPPVALDYLLQPHVPGIDAASALKRLVNMRLAHRERGSARYSLHPVDRAYALEQIPGGQTSDRFETAPPPFTRISLSHRAAEFFAESRKPREEWKSLDDLAPQLDEYDLRCEGQDYDTAAGVLLEIDFDYLLLWGHFQLLADLHQRLRGRVRDAEAKMLCANSCGSSLLHLGQVHEAERFFNETLVAARELEDRDGEGAALGNLGICYASFGQLERAMEHQQQALAIAREIGDRSGEATRLSSLGFCYEQLGQLDRAIDHYQQALAIDRENGNRPGEAANLGQLGDCYASLGQLERAMEHQQQALAIDEDIGNRFGEAEDLGSLGLYCHSLGQVKQAMEHHSQALAIDEDIGDRAGEARHLGNLGICYHSLGQLERAMECLQQSLDIFRDIGSRYGESCILEYLAVCHSELGRLDRAVELLNQALELSRAVGHRNNEAENLYFLGAIQRDLGRLDDGIKYSTQAMEIARETLNRHLQAAANMTWGGVQVDQGNPEAARERLTRALVMADEVDEAATQCQGRWELARAQLLCSDHRSARATAEASLPSAVPRELPARCSWA